MSFLPATGGTAEQVILPGIDPLKVRYGQIVGAFIRDCLDANGNFRNLADPSVGLGVKGVFTPFAADGLTIREDLLFNSNGGTNNQGFFNFGLTKEDSISVAPDQTVQMTPTGQTLRSVRNIYTKIEDKVSLTPIENNTIIQRLWYNLPLTGFVPNDGTPGYQLVRGETDVLIERQLILFLIDTDGQLLAEVFPRLGPDKTGKIEFGRKSPYAPDSFSWDVLPDPFTQASMWICEAGTAWQAEADFEFETTAPSVTPVTGLKATVIVPTPADIVTPTYTVALQSTAGGPFTAGTVGTPAPVASDGFTTISVTGLTASAVFNALQVTATGGGITATSPVSASFTATAS
jgi:hypothetical protein